MLLQRRKADPMTVKLIKDYLGDKAGAIKTYEAGTETALTRSNLAQVYSTATDTPPDTVVATGVPIMADAIRNFYPFWGATAQSFIIPPNSQVNYIKNTILTGAQMGAGAVTITGGPGVTIAFNSGMTNVSKPNMIFQILNIDTNIWLLFGGIGG